MKAFAPKAAARSNQCVQRIGVKQAGRSPHSARTQFGLLKTCDANFSLAPEIGLRSIEQFDAIDSAFSASEIEGPGLAAFADFRSHLNVIGSTVGVHDLQIQNVYGISGDVHFDRLEAALAAADFDDIAITQEADRFAAELLPSSFAAAIMISPVTITALCVDHRGGHQRRQSEARQ
jgi:hypothetical protein